MPPSHPALERWIRECADLCEPDRIVRLNGSPRERRALLAEALRAGELIRLNPKTNPDSYLHRSDPDDVARVEHLTYVCTRRRANAGPTNNWMSPAAAKRKASPFFRGAMRGRTMYVVPFTMGLPDSPFAKVGVQLTDSVYVALSMGVMTHMGTAALKRLGRRGAFTRCLHSKADLNVERRLVLHFPEENAIWSVGSDYGGNALLGKKCMALRIASWLGHDEGWMAEHMLILGVEDPRGRVTYVGAAFPSACGKTNLAMLVPPPRFRAMGYRVWTVGDDIAWLRRGAGGALRAVNPEAGLFGVAPGTNARTNPNAMAAIGRNTIFTNVLLTPHGAPWWEGADGPPPTRGTDWRGRPWRPGRRDENGRPVRGAHPNSRFTTPLAQCPSLSPAYYEPRGVRLSAILFGGRRARLAPLVAEARTWSHGVFMGAAMASETTAARMGTVGEVRRDPMAMLPFCGYDMGRYFGHWLRMGERLAEAPRIFQVNWFRKDAAGRFLWPGFGENFRVLKWVVDRCRGEAGAEEAAIGRIPRPADFDLSGLDLSPRAWAGLFATPRAEWAKDLDDLEAFFKRFGRTLPRDLWREFRAARARARALR